MSESLLEPEFLSRLEYLHVVTRELFVGHASAERVSKKFGVGIEFADHRAYAPGDDFRYIDWSVYARSEDLLVKLFTEEQALKIYLILDASRSMGVGDPEKFFYAKKVAAALGYIGLANQDSVSLVAFDDRLRAQSRSFQSRGQLRQMIQYLQDLQPSGAGTALGLSVNEFVQRFRSRGLVVVLSDFLDRPGYEEALRLLHYHRHDFLTIQINDREELEPSMTGDVQLIDAESGFSSNVQITPQAIVAYKQRIADHYSELIRLCKILGRGHVPVRTDTPFEDLIFDVFRRGRFLR